MIVTQVQRITCEQSRRMDTMHPHRYIARIVAGRVQLIQQSDWFECSPDKAAKYEVYIKTLEWIEGIYPLKFHQQVRRCAAAMATAQRPRGVSYMERDFSMKDYAVHLECDELYNENLKK